MRDACCEMVASARQRGARVITAGSDATDAPEPYLRAGADLVLMGEGLETLMAVVPRLEASLTQETARLVEGLSGLATMVRGEVSKVRAGGSPVHSFQQKVPPAWDLVNIERYRSVWRKAQWLLQSQHGLLEGLLVPVCLVRQADLG